MGFKLKQTVAENAKISPFLVFYLIIGMQIGIGVLGYQRHIAKAAGYDAWISVVVGGLVIHLILWMIFRICETVEGDFVQAHQYVFGEIVGRIISSFFMLYSGL